MKRPSLAPLSEQVMVITGASSGIGLCTARAAARAGARVVLGARSADVLERIVDEIDAEGGDAVAVEVDVSDLPAVERLATRAIERYGRIDTWVNNAGVSIYGELLETPIEDHRRLFETNYWGVVHGSIVAARHIERGAIVNVGSVAGERAIPLQGAYSASKHAVKGFTEALRMELEHAGVPISVTLVKPSSIATPYHEHARALTEHEPRNAPPVYAPELVANAILRAATEPVRDVSVGGAGRALTAFSAVAPRLADRFLEGTLFRMQQTATPVGPDGDGNGRREGTPPPAQPVRARRDNLFEPTDDARERGHYAERVFERSATDRAAEHPLRTLLVGAVLVAGVALLVRSL
ncbi:MAG TPA: SDR family oxidoreductase [Sandaracinaceae bacterium]